MDTATACETTTPSTALVPPGGGRAFAAFLAADDRDALGASLEREGMVVVELEGIGPSARGRLGEVLDELVERSLVARGAIPPGLRSGHDRDATLGDQLFRARRAGASGLAFILGPLRAATGPGGSLEPEDSATLRFLAAAARTRPVVLALDARDETTGAYGDPVRLTELLAPQDGNSRTETETETQAVAALTPTPTPTLTPTPTPTPTPEPDPPLPPLPLRHTAGVAVATRDDRWRAWTLQLSAARGPQPLAVLERLFADSYMPLANAIASGLEEPRARAARDEFASTFSRGYTDASTTFATATKRPKMVLDAHDVAARIARLHGARSTRVLVVDAMRWDVSRQVEERLVTRLGARAALTDELVLWSALPTTTSRQLETLARGVEALRAPALLDEEPDPPRGRSAEFVRRLRVGPREVHKLDVVASRVRGLRGDVVAHLPEIADVTAEALAHHAETLAPRTLLFVTGDHGFAIDRTGTVREGGASPEEVLVGAFGLLVGDVH